MRRWEEVGDGRVVTSAICEAEIRFGIRKKGSDRLAALFAELLPRVSILPVDSLVAAAYAEMRAACEAAGRTVADMDLLIAATAKVHGLTVATLNFRHFEHIPGITVEDWSTPNTVP
jgi:tRNA(fMet)-specific endonuclease VapC